MEPLDKWLFEPVAPITDDHEFAYKGMKRNYKDVIRSVWGTGSTDAEALTDAKKKARRVDVQELMDRENNV